MKKLLFVLSAALLAGCARETQVVVIVTATPPPVTDTVPPPSDTPPPTDTPEPTPTPLPSSTPTPSWEPIAINQFEQALRDAGYSRYPWTTGDGLSAFDWVYGNAYETISTWENGSFELQVLHDASPRVRMENMEKKFKVMDRAFPAEFMAQLRAANESYNDTVRADVSGTPDDQYAYGGEWQEVWASYYSEYQQIGSYDVWFTVWWWQSTCPPQYLYCYYPGFPGLEFTGDSSFKFYTIYVEPVVPELPSNTT